MGWVDDLKRQVVALDIAPLIYFIEEHPTYLAVVEPFFRAMDESQLSVITSTVTLLEVLVFPIAQRNNEAINKYREVLLSAHGLATVDLSPVIAVEAAQLRAMYNIPTPDAIQLGTALHMNATAFLTNDRALRKVAEIDVLIVDDV